MPKPGHSGSAAPSDDSPEFYEGLMDGLENEPPYPSAATERKLERLKADYLSLARWARQQNAGNAFATQVALYAEARLAEWDEPVERWEP